MRIIVLSIILLASCGLQNVSVTRKFTFYKDNRPSDLKFRVPKGFNDEKVKVGNDAKEQFYVYPDGSILFIGLNVHWPTTNEVRNLLPQRDTLTAAMYKGIDSSGLHWKEIYIDGFVVGYSFVPSSKRESFEQAVHSIRFR